MNPEEALKVLDALYNANSLFEYMNSIYDDAEIFYSAVKVSMDALKKQIPMKPDEHPEQVQKHMNLGVKAPFCPKCGNDLLDEKNDCYDFCPHCGQAIDWGECNGTDSQN